MQNKSNQLRFRQRLNVSGIPDPLAENSRGAVATAKRAIARTLSSRWVAPAWGAIAQDRVAFLTLHRFAEPENGVYGHDPALLRLALERLRRERYDLIGVSEAMHRLGERTGFRKRSVVFTMDDGYRGALDQCSDIFLAYDCPLTVFLATGFIDGTCWLWWDQIEYICLTSDRASVDVEFEGKPIHLDLGTDQATTRSVLEICNWCKSLADERKWRFIRCLSQAAEVALPMNAPAHYAPVSWSEARALEKKGFFFGPHTVTHPILPRTDDGQAKREISQSWSRVRSELKSPANVLSYPNGDYGPREVELLAESGLAAAVTTRPAYPTSGSNGLGGDRRFEIPRFSYPESPELLMLVASGFRDIRPTLNAFAAR